MLKALDNYYDMVYIHNMTNVYKYLKLKGYNKDKWLFVTTNHKKFIRWSQLYPAKNLKWIVADYGSYGIKKEKYDLILCDNVLYKDVSGGMYGSSGIISGIALGMPFIGQQTLDKVAEIKIV